VLDLTKRQSQGCLFSKPSTGSAGSSVWKGALLKAELRKQRSLVAEV